MKKDFVYWLRWVAVLPGSLIVGILATFVLHWVLYLSLANGSTISGVNIGPIEYNLYPMVIAAVFVLTGYEIAPLNKFKTSIILASIWLISFVLIFIFLSHLKPKFELRSILALVGILLGLAICWSKSKSES